MQPEDAQHLREFYRDSPSYWGQRKVDGNKWIVFASKDQCWFQSRTMRLVEPFAYEVVPVFQKIAKLEGDFILEGEVTYLDFRQQEHRTGSQAASVNLEAGRGQDMPKQLFYAFSCPWQDKQMLRTYGDMVARGKVLADLVHALYPDVLSLDTHKTDGEKDSLCFNNTIGGYEGEVWFQPSIEYRAGKNKDDRFVRTKYLIDLIAWVSGFTDTTAEGHAFGAMSIETSAGDSLGNIGTGFTREDKRKLLAKFQKEGKFQVNSVAQKITEYGKVEHGRFESIV